MSYAFKQQMNTLGNISALSKNCFCSLIKLPLFGQCKGYLLDKLRYLIQKKTLHLQDGDTELRLKNQYKIWGPQTDCLITNILSDFHFTEDHYSI